MSLCLRRANPIGPLITRIRFKGYLVKSIDRQLERISCTESPDFQIRAVSALQRYQSFWAPNLHLSSTRLLVRISAHVMKRLEKSIDLTTRQTLIYKSHMCPNTILRLNKYTHADCAAVHWGVSTQLNIMLITSTNNPFKILHSKLLSRLQHVFVSFTESHWTAGDASVCFQPTRHAMSSTVSNLFTLINSVFTLFFTMWNNYKDFLTLPFDPRWKIM